MKVKDKDLCIRVLNAITKGCDKLYLIEERFGTQGSYLVKKMLREGYVSKEKGGFYKKIQDLPFTNDE